MYPYVKVVFWLYEHKLAAAVLGVLLVLATSCGQPPSTGPCPGDDGCPTVTVPPETPNSPPPSGLPPLSPTATPPATPDLPGTPTPIMSEFIMTNDQHSPGDPILCAIALDGHGNPLAGVTIDIGQIGNDGLLWQITTGEDGSTHSNACAYPLEEGRYVLRAWAANVAFGPTAYLVDASGSETVMVTFRKVSR